MKRLLGIILSITVLITSFSASLSFVTSAASTKTVLGAGVRDSITEDLYDTAVLGDRIVDNDLTVYADLSGSICGMPVDSWTMKSLKNTEFYGSTYSYVYTPNCYNNGSAAPSITYRVAADTKLMFAIGMISAMDDLWNDFSIMYSADGETFGKVDTEDITYTTEEDITFSTSDSYTVGDIRTYSIIIEQGGYIKITFPVVSDIRAVAQEVNGSVIYGRTGAVFVVPAAAFSYAQLSAGETDVFTAGTTACYGSTIYYVNETSTYATLSGHLVMMNSDNISSWIYNDYGTDYSLTGKTYVSPTASSDERYIEYRVSPETLVKFEIAMWEAVWTALTEKQTDFSFEVDRGDGFEALDETELTYTPNDNGTVRYYEYYSAERCIFRITFPDTSLIGKYVDENKPDGQSADIIYRGALLVSAFSGEVYNDGELSAGETDVFTAGTTACYGSTIYYVNETSAYATLSGRLVMMDSNNVKSWVYDNYGTDYALSGKTYVSPTASSDERYIEYNISPKTLVKFEIAMWSAVWTALTEKETDFSFEVDKGNGFAALDETELTYTLNDNGTVRYYEYYSAERCVFRITLPDTSLIGEYINANKPEGQSADIMFRGAFLISAFSGEKYAYSPQKAVRYYAEDIKTPLTVSALIQTNEKNFGGAVLSSEDFTLDIANKGYPRVTLSGGDEINFPVDVRADDFNHIAVSCDVQAGKWYLYLNGTKTSTVSGAAVSAETIEKLCIGASADKYNNNYFKGSVAELAVYSETLTDDEISALKGGIDTSADSVTAYWNLAGGDKTDGTANGNTLFSETVSAVTEKPESGITFTNKKGRLDSYEIYDTAVNTFETWLKIDSKLSADSAAGCVFSSYYGSTSTAVDYLQISVGTGGNPLLEFRSGGVTETYRFDVDVTTGKWLHLAITADYESGYYNCYVNGMLADSVAVGTLKIPVSHRAYCVSGFYIGSKSTVYFNGSLAGTRIYSDSRTGEEILEDVYSTDISDDGMMAYWKMQDKKDGLLDLKGTNDLHTVLTDTAKESADETFGNYSTFVFIPDTQCLTEDKGAEGLSKITDWILNNKESENIVGVMGLGDITDNNNDADWTAAATAYEALKGEVPYVFIAGNHDMEMENPSADNPRDVSMFNQYFPYEDWRPYMSGFYEEGKIDNMYYLLDDVNGQKYMLLGLEFQPRDAVLEWADNIVAQYSDYKVIVATHGYQYEDGVTGENTYISSNSYENVLGSDSNWGSGIWDKFVSRHENIQAVICGHTGTENVCYTTNTGVNGNTVVEIIANSQYTERPFGTLGAIMILRVSEDGTKANINYYSTYQDKYIKDINQFNIDWIVSYAAEAGGVKYKTLEEALAAVGDGEKVTLLDNITVTDTISVSKNIQIDTDNFTITNDGGTPVFSIADGMGMSIVDGVYTFASSKTIADTDSDGYVSALDLSYLRRKLLGCTTDTKYFDINGDGACNIIDLIRAKKVSVG